MRQRIIYSGCFPIAMITIAVKSQSSRLRFHWKVTRIALILLHWDLITQLIMIISYFFNLIDCHYDYSNALRLQTTITPYLVHTHRFLPQTLAKAALKSRENLTANVFPRLRHGPTCSTTPLPIPAPISRRWARALPRTIPSTRSSRVKCRWKATRWSWACSAVSCCYSWWRSTS